MNKLSLALVLLLIVGCEVSDETKIRDTKIAFEKIKFDPRVSNHIKEINEITDLIILHRDSIFLYNGLEISGDKRNLKNKSVSISGNRLNQTLPAPIASEISVLLNKLPAQMIITTSLYMNGDIIYSIRPEKAQSKAVNYKVQHRLIYGNRKSTNGTLRSVKDVLSKENSIDRYQYYIKVAPYNGW